MDMIFFDSWEVLIRIVISASLVYFCIVVFLKISGKRSTSQLNNFDWVVTVMMGSIGASTILLKNVPIIEGMVSLITLLGLQYLVTKFSAISPAFSQVILSEPKIVFYQGEFLPDIMKQERLNRQEIECAMRSAGIHDYQEVAAVVFESDAKLTVIPKRDSELDLNDKDIHKMSDTLNILH